MSKHSLKSLNDTIAELTADDIATVSGAGQDGSDLLIVNNGDGSDFLER